MPLQHRHTYTAEFDVTSPLAQSTSFGVAPEGVRCNPAQIRQVRAGGTLEGLSHWLLAHTFPSCLPDPGRLTVPTRPVVVGAACRPSLRSQGQTAPNFGRLLRQPTGGALSSPPGFMAPRGAQSCSYSRYASHGW